MTYQFAHCGEIEREQTKGVLTLKMMTLKMSGSNNLMSFNHCLFLFCKVGLFCCLWVSIFLCVLKCSLCEELTLIYSLTFSWGLMKLLKVIKDYVAQFI